VEHFDVISGFVIRCRNCHRIVLARVPYIGARESDALVSHLKDCRPDLVAREEPRWRTEMGSLLEQFDVTRTP
jgi:hypothetical protein